MIGARLRPDIAEVQSRWAGFWAGESRRPMVWARCPKPGREYEARIRELWPHYPQRPTDDLDQHARNLLEVVTTCYDYVGDEVPYFEASFGPDQMAGFFGQKIEYSAESDGTSWSKPFDGELEDLLPLIQADVANPMYAAMLDYHRKLAEVADGRLVVGGLDYHSNFDALAAMRDPRFACLDLIEKPEVVKTALNLVNEAYQVFYNHFYDVARMATVGTGGWVNAYSTGRYQSLNSDFICLLSPSQVDEFVIPCLEAEVSVLDQAIFHLDGPDAMKHVKSLAAIEKIKAFQWVPGAGNPQAGPYWLDFYRHILSTGTGLWMELESAEAVQAMHRELRSNNVIYVLSVGTPREVEELLRWLERDLPR